MIQCADLIIGNAVSGFDCQLPMSMKIGLFFKLNNYVQVFFRPYLLSEKNVFNYFDISLLISLYMKCEELNVLLNKK